LETGIFVPPVSCSDWNLKKSVVSRNPPDWLLTKVFEFAIMVTIS
jgi:hypothetical protein